MIKDTNLYTSEVDLNQTIDFGLELRHGDLPHYTNRRPEILVGESKPAEPK
jgi:hypothetical protein